MELHKIHRLDNIVAKKIVLGMSIVLDTKMLLELEKNYLTDANKIIIEPKSISTY